MLPASRPRHILVIDDESVIADTLALILCLNGYRSTAVYSGEAALERAREIKPDVLLSDVVLDGITGIEVAIRFSALYPDCRVILFSGQPVTADLLEEAERQQGRQFEIHPKPVHPDDLLALLAAPEHPPGPMH
jgi:DNA-binding NtrC family response regulator